MSETIDTKLAGEVFDENKRLIGRYINLLPEDQNLLDLFCESWLKTYRGNEDFFLTIDLETTGLKPHKGSILLVSISWDGKNAIVFSPRNYNLTKFLEVLETIPLNNQNIKFDLKWLAYHYGVYPKVYMDTMVCSQLGWAGVFPQTAAGTFSLGNIAKHLLTGYELEKETRKQFIGMSADAEFTTEQIEYAVKDSLITHKLVKPIRTRLHNQDLWSIWENIERPLIEILVRSELKGVKINVEELERLLYQKETELTLIYNQILEEIKNIPPSKLPTFPKDKFNPASSQQIVNLLSAVGIKVLNTEKSVLQSAQAASPHPLLQGIIEWRKTKSIISKFLTKWLEEHIDHETNCIYTTINTYGSETGRLSAKEPNLMQVPGDLRSMIVARPDHKILSIDFSQFEFRAAAAATEEPFLIEAFEDRARLLPLITELAQKYKYIDPDSFVKAVTKKAVSISEDEYKLVHDFALTDIHRRNASLILGKDVAEVTDKDRAIGKCVSIDSHVHTNKGIFKVRDFLPKKLKKDTYYDLKGVKVLTDTGYEEAPTIYYYGKSPVLKVTTKSGRELICTKVHRFRTLDKHGKYVWIQAGKLKPGMDVFIKTEAPFEGKLNYPLGFTKKEQYLALLEFVGLALQFNQINSSYVTLPGNFLDRVNLLLSTMGFKKTKINGPTKMSNFIHIYRPEIIEWIGDPEGIPEQLLHNCDEKSIIAFLKGFAFKTNVGHTFKGNNTQLKLVQNLLLRVGVPSYRLRSLYPGASQDLLNVYGENQEYLISKFNNTKFEFNECKLLKVSGTTKVHQKMTEIGLLGIGDPPKINSKLITLLANGLGETTLDSLLFLMKMKIRRDTVVSVTPLKTEMEVADFSVPSTSTVVYEGFITHNTLGYAVLYGAGPTRVQESLAKEGFYYTLSECKDFLTSFFAKLPKINLFIKETHARVLDPMFIQTPIGRKRFFSLPPKYLTRKYATESEAAFREATNFCFQGANADATKKSVVLIDDFFKQFDESVRPIILLTVHDEIVIEVHDSIVDEVSRISKKIMIEAGMESINFRAPIECSTQISSYWSK